MAPGAAGRTASSAWAGRGQCGSGVSTVHAGLSVTLAELALSLPGDSRAPRRPALSPGQWHRPLHLPGPVLHPGDANCLRPPGSSGQLWQPVPLRTLRTVRETSYPRHGPAVVAPHSGACTPRALGSMEWGGPLIPRPGVFFHTHGCWQNSLPCSCRTHGSCFRAGEKSSLTLFKELSSNLVRPTQGDSPL